jgi:hypothetical protein
MRTQPTTRRGTARHIRAGLRLGWGSMPPRARGVTVIAPKHGADRRALAWICTVPSEVGRCSACDDLPCAVVDPLVNWRLRAPVVGDRPVSRC